MAKSTSNGQRGQNSAIRPATKWNSASALAAVPAPERLAARASTKAGIVGAAVSAQLYEELTWPPVNTNKKFGSDYKYGNDTMFTFLMGVNMKMKKSSPRYSFKFDDAFILTALGATAIQLTAQIAAVAVPA